MSRFIEMFGNPIGNEYKWPQSVLGECCEINPTRPKGISDDTMVSFIPMQDIYENGTTADFDIKPYSEVKKGFTYCANGDVLFAKITPCMENGKGAELNGLCNGIGMGSTEFHVLRPKAEVTNSTWLYYLTKLDVFRTDASKNMTGSGGQRRVPSSYLSTFKIGLPSIEQQNKFATIVQQADKSKFGDFKSRFIEMFEDGKWELKPLGEVGTFKRGGGFQKSDYVEHGIPCIHYGQIHTKFGPFISSHISEISSALENKTKFATMGDLVIAITSEDAEGSCKCTAWLGDYPVAVGGHAAIFKHNMDPLFMTYYFRSKTFNHAKLKYIHDSKVVEIRPDDIANILVPCPPMSLQEQFSAIAHQADKSKSVCQIYENKMHSMCA